ncbi:putative monothiol glutaredoxin ycf64-like isoform X2 [Lycorma delicatula]|uniref:putative monothiol glutaredoxin ycf64-like isoform X2 n=1 Tax=Lycorma delicatula TaxID=130591 RepID=UPI003F50EEE9
MRTVPVFSFIIFGPMYLSTGYDIYDLGSYELKDYEPFQYSPQEVNEKMKHFFSKAEIILFIKGEKKKPLCGYSEEVIKMLKETRFPIKTCDITKDAKMKDLLRLYNNYTNFPQLYVRGLFLGGYDEILYQFRYGSIVKRILDLREKNVNWTKTK